MWIYIGPKISEFRYLLTQGKAASNFSYEEIISFPFFESFLHQENPEQGMMFGDYVDFEEMKKSAEEKSLSAITSNRLSQENSSQPKSNPWWFCEKR